MKRLLLLILCLGLAGCGAGTIHPPSQVCEAHGGVKNVQINYQGDPGEKQDTLCNDGFYKVEPE